MTKLEWTKQNRMTNDEHPPLPDDAAPGAVDDFDLEVTRTRRNAKLMKLLDERGRQTVTLPLDEVKRRLGLGNK